MMLRPASAVVAHKSLKLMVLAQLRQLTECSKVNSPQDLLKLEMRN
jgi:hypothetical protein